MNLLKRTFLLWVFLCGAICTNSILAQTNPKYDKQKKLASVSFETEDIEKVKTLIEHQIGRSISLQEFEVYGNATKENLQLFQLINKNLKEDPFFSQPHISYIIDSMEDRLGLKKPEPKNAKPKPKSNSKISRKM